MYRQVTNIQPHYPASIFVPTNFDQFYVVRDASSPHLSSSLTLLTAASPPGPLRALDGNPDDKACLLAPCQQESTWALFLSPMMNRPILSSPTMSPRPSGSSYLFPHLCSRPHHHRSSVLLTEHYSNDSRVSQHLRLDSHPASLFRSVKEREWSPCSQSD